MMTDKVFIGKDGSYEMYYDVKESKVYMTNGFKTLFFSVHSLGDFLFQRREKMYGVYSVTYI